MNKVTAILIGFVLATTPVLFGQSKAGNAAGTVNSITVVAKERATVLMSKQGVTIDVFEPYPFSGYWTFVWNGDSVDFTGVFDFGDYQTITTADGVGGVTKQLFYGLSHHVKGTASWDEMTRILSYDLEPEVREDAKASTVIQSKPAECVKVSGRFAEEACKSFEESSLGFEGLKLKFVFAEDKSSFKGQADLIQYGGKFFTENEATSVVQLSGDLVDK